MCDEATGASASTESNEVKDLDAFFNKLDFGADSLDWLNPVEWLAQDKPDPVACSCQCD